MVSIVVVTLTGKMGGTSILPVKMFVTKIKAATGKTVTLMVRVNKALVFNV